MRSPFRVGPALAGDHRDALGAEVRQRGDEVDLVVAEGEDLGHLGQRGAGGRRCGRRG